MSHLFILRDGQPVPEDDQWAWTNWFEASVAERLIARDVIGTVRIITAFTGRNTGMGQALELWETQLRGGLSFHDETERYTSREAAEAGHERWVREVKAAMRETS